MPVLVNHRASERKQPPSWLRWGTRALFVGGLILLGYVAFALVQARLYDADAKQYVNSALSVNQTRLHSLSKMHPPESTLIEGEILGHIEIPRLGVSAAVLQGTAPRTLRLGVGHIHGTAMPGTAGNSAIAGHRDTFFRALKNIHSGDEIELRTADTSTHYLVDWARVVPPGDTSVLDSTSDSALTLVTCYPFYFIGASPERFVVRAHKVPTATLDRLRPNHQPAERCRCPEECNEVLALDRSDRFRVGNRIVLCAASSTGKTHNERRRNGCRGRDNSQPETACDSEPGYSSRRLSDGGSRWPPREGETMSSMAA